MQSHKSVHSIVARLYEWSATITRDLPWKASNDPYQIWLSEIILQQTRVAQGRPYWQRFVSTYPTVGDLAAASQEEVYKLWEGLGYYSRARNLHAAAVKVMEEHEGIFPRDYSGLLSLPGVGPYTAAAIASFAYGLPHAVVDGNVMRVITRLYDSHLPIDTIEGKNYVQTQVDRLLDRADPARFNQAIMDFGALQCVPRNPMCTDCPLQADCLAYQRDTVADLPVKAKKLKKRTRHFHYLFLIDTTGYTLLHKRQDGDIWAGLYEWPMIETVSDDVPLPAAWVDRGFDVVKVTKSKIFKQSLTHQHIRATISIAQVEHDLPTYNSYTRVSLSDIADYAFPRLIRHAWEELKPLYT